MPKVVEKDDDLDHDNYTEHSEPVDKDPAINKTQMINEVFDQIFSSDANNQLNLVSERSNNRQKPPAPLQHNGSIAMTEKSIPHKVKKINLRSFNSKSIEIKKSLSISHEKSKRRQDGDDLSISESDKGSKVNLKDNATGEQSDPVKSRKPGSPTPFSQVGATANEQTLMQHIFMANPVQSKVIPAGNVKGRLSEKHANVSKNGILGGGDDEKTKSG